MSVRTVGTLTALLVTVTACSFGGDPAGRGAGGSGGESAEASERRYVQALEQAVPLAARELSATEVDLFGRWTSCLAGYQYRGTGAIHAAGEGRRDQLEAIRASLTAAGFTDVTRLESHVSVHREDFELDIQAPRPQPDPTLWTLSFQSDCRRLHGADADRAKADTGNDFAGLRP